jgi:hypothetical protein
LDGTTDPPDPGELIYKSGDITLTRRWVWRQGRVGSVIGPSRLLAVNVDLIDRSLLEEPTVLSTVTRLLGVVGYEVVHIMTLDSSARHS